MGKLITFINLIVFGSLIAYLLKLSVFDNNNGFLWRALALTIVFTLIVIGLTWKKRHTISSVTGIINVFMFLFVVSATIPIDGISCLSYGHPLINPKSCGGGVNYHSLWAGMFGSNDGYTPYSSAFNTTPDCKSGYAYSESKDLCTKNQLGFYQRLSNNKAIFDYKTLILNLGWILFPIGCLFAYVGLGKKRVKEPNV
jgi:hypothetical protein